MYSMRETHEGCMDMCIFFGALGTERTSYSAALQAPLHFNNAEALTDRMQACLACADQATGAVGLAALRQFRVSKHPKRSC